jgi:hypothetical protein
LFEKYGIFQIDNTELTNAWAPDEGIPIHGDCVMIRSSETVIIVIFHVVRFCGWTGSLLQRKLQ